MIPPIIHQIWIGPPITVKEKLKFMSTFENVPGFEYRLWTNADIVEKNFPCTYSYIRRLLAASRIVYAKIADLMRYEIIYRFGGFYFDTNMELLKPRALHDLRRFSLVVCNERKTAAYLSNGFFAARAHHEGLKHILYDKLPAVNLSTKANVSTGPYLFVNVLEYKDEHTNILDTVDIYPNGTGPANCRDDCRRRHPKSIAVDHFEYGCSWCIHTKLLQKRVLLVVVFTIILLIAAAITTVVLIKKF